MSNGQQTSASAYENQRPDEIEREIAGTRSELDQTLDALQERLSAGSLIDQARGYLRDGTSGSREFMANLSESIRRNPVPAALIGVGIAWMMMAGARGQSSAGYQPNRQLPMRTEDINEGPLGATGELGTSSDDARRDRVEQEGLTREDREMRNLRPGEPSTPGL